MSSSDADVRPLVSGGLAGARVTVMGLGLFGGGAGAARHLAGLDARVTVTDLRAQAELSPTVSELVDLDLRFVLGEHRLEDFTDCDLVVANPAVASDNRYLAAARAAGVPVTTEAELFLLSCPARVVAVTGTHGKSSTCHVLHQLLEAAALPSHLGGNIGGSLLDRLATLRTDDIVVLELSSYQLESLDTQAVCDTGRVQAVAVTNVCVDHLERHKTVADYARTKGRILELVDGRGHAFLPADDEVSRRWSCAATRVEFGSSPTAPATLRIEEGRFRFGALDLGRVDALPLAGTFQQTNALLALGLAHTLGAGALELRRALPDLRGLPHRLEDLGPHRGHRVWDNAVSTTPESTAAALRCARVPTTLLCGGRIKDLPLEPLLTAARDHARRVIVFGEAGEVLEEALSGAGVCVLRSPDLEQGTRLAFRDLLPGEELLFSPACSSFDAFPNFRARALAFRRLLETCVEDGTP